MQLCFEGIRNGMASDAWNMKTYLKKSMSMCVGEKIEKKQGNINPVKSISNSLVKCALMNI